MRLLLLLSAILSALTGASGGVRVVEAPAVAARMVEAAVVEMSAQRQCASRLEIAPPVAVRVVSGVAFVLVAIFSPYDERRRE